MKFGLLLLVMLFLAFMGLGQGAMGPDLIWEAVRGDEQARLIITEYRLPRILAAMLIGAGLGMTGACQQGVTRNPLADHSLLGVSGFAALFCVISFYLLAQQSSIILVSCEFVRCELGHHLDLYGRGPRGPRQHQAYPDGPGP